MTAPTDMWKNRRRMAWISLGVLALEGPAVLIVAIIDAQAIASASALLSTLALSLAGVVGAYMGFATAGDKWSTR